MSGIAARAPVPARMSNPPPKVSTSFRAAWNDPVEVEPVTSVKTTSVNIASVVPVRKRLRSGYAIDIRRSGVRALTRPRTAIIAPSSRSAL